MASMIGTEKQIAWAQQIQASAVKACDDLAAMHATRPLVSSKGAEEIPGAIRDWLLSITDARFFIEMRGPITDARTLLRYFVQEDGSAIVRMAAKARVMVPALPSEVTGLARPWDE